jgi:hypothetical protein
VVLGRTFAVLALLFSIATPFMDDLPSRWTRWTFLLAGFAYSAFLAFLVTGLLLLPQRRRSQVFTALQIFGAFAALISWAVFAVLYFRLPLSIVRYCTQPFLWASCPFIPAMLGFACYGWYHRLTHDASTVA